MLCRIDILGSLRVTQAGQIITRFRTRKAAALLGYLAYHSHRMHSRDDLVGILWPEGDDESGRHSLRTDIHSLRCQLEPPGVPAGSILIADRHSVGLNEAVVTTDAGLFRSALRAAAATRAPTERAQCLGEAVDLYRGELLAGCCEAWIEGEREHLLQQFLGAAEGLIECLEHAGDLASALEYAHRLVSADPLREESHERVMRLYAAFGRAQAALRHYQEWERTSRRELDAPPSTQLRALARRIEERMEAQEPHSGRTPVSAPAAQRGLASAGALAKVQTSAARAPVVTLAGTVTVVVVDVGDPAGPRSEPDAAGDASRALLQEHGGRIVREAGGVLAAAFAGTGRALAAALACHRMGAGQGAPDPGEGVPRRSTPHAAGSASAHPPVPGPPGRAAAGQFPIRVALHTADVDRGATGLEGGAASASSSAHVMLQAATRMLLAAHEGQILCSEETAALLRRCLEPGVLLTDLGAHRLSIGAPVERIFQIAYVAMPTTAFPPLRARQPRPPSCRCA